MTKVADVRIYPGFFRARREPERPRAGAGAAPRSRVKANVAHKPNAPRAKYAMPVIPIIAAAATIIGGATAFAAATTIIGMVAAGAVIVGGAMMMVGTLTDRPNLTKWGGILAAVGGIGLAFEGAGLLGSEAGSEAVVNPGDADQLLANETAAGKVAPPPVQPPPPEPAPPAQPPAPAAQPQGTGMLSDAPPAATATPANQAPTTAPQGPNAFRSDAPAPVGDRSAFTTTPPGQTSTSGYFDSFGRWVRNNKELAQIGAQFATSAFSSAVPRPTTAYEEAATEEARRRAARMDPNSAWWRKQPSGG